METGTHAPALRSANEVPYSPVAFGQQYACLPKLDAILREAQPSAASHRRNLPPITTSGGGEPPGGERRPAFERGAQRNPQLLNRLRRTERNARRGGRRSPSRPTTDQATTTTRRGAGGGAPRGEARRAGCVFTGDVSRCWFQAKTGNRPLPPRRYALLSSLFRINPPLFSDTPPIAILFLPWSVSSMHQNDS